MLPEDSRLARVGAVVAVAAVVLAWFVFRLASGSGLFTGTVRYRTRFPATQGLAEGAQVRLKGVNVGAVRSIDFAKDANDIVVEFAVKRSVASRIDKNVTAELQSNGPLGDKLIELKRPDAAPEAPLPAGAFVPGKPPISLSTMMDQGADLYADIKSISESLRVITGRLVEGNGVVGRLLQDKEYGEQTLTDLQASISRLREIMESSSEGRNLVGLFVGDEKLADQVRSDLSTSLKNLDTITTRIEHGDGAFGQMIDPNSELSRAVGDFATAARNLRSFSERLEAAKGGLVDRMLLDPEYGQQVAEDVQSTLHHLRRITEKIDEGQGSAALLLNDKRMYEGVSDIVHGIQRSWFVNFILKRKEKKGFEERVDRILRESPDPDADLLELVRQVLQQEKDEKAGPDQPLPAPRPATPPVPAASTTTRP